MKASADMLVKAVDDNFWKGKNTVDTKIKGIPSAMMFKIARVKLRRDLH